MANGTGTFTLPVTGTYFIEASASSANQTGPYTVALGDATTPFPVLGTVTKSTVVSFRTTMAALKRYQRTLD